MLIDWTTVIFQVVNFLILIALLKRFLYGPILKAMDEREKTIAKHLAQASQAEKEAQNHAMRLAADQQEFSLRREQLQLEAKDEIEKWKEESIERLNTQIAIQKETWQKNLEDEQEAFLKKLKITISRQVFEVSRKVLADLADNKLETRMIEIFLEKINSESEPRAEIPEHLMIISGFPLDADVKKNLEKSLKKSFLKQGKVQFKEDTELGFGIRLLAGNHKWEWNLSRYMNDIENEIIRTMSRAK
jgi:F-type H+-transporting ATPase subunit b